MAETKQKKQFFTVGGVFFLLIVIPLALMAFLIANGMFKLGSTIKERAVNVIDQKSQDEIKLRAINTADEVASFLNERKKDVLMATILSANEAVYKQFVSENKKNIWTKEEGKIKQISIPLYTEMAFINKKGKEVIKIANGKTVAAEDLTDVSNPANTSYKSEDYFKKAKDLNQGEVYVSPVTGWYLNRLEFEKGKEFSGIIRFATPVFGKDGFSGVIVLTLDHRHLAKFTNQVVPTQQNQVLKADPSTGNYAFMVDYRGYIIAHPNDYHIVGLNSDGTTVTTLNAQNATELTQKGIEALDLFQLGFMDPNLPKLAKEAATGQPGLSLYKFAGRTKLVAYAPIKLYASNLPAPTGFGWIMLGIDVGKYNEAALEASKAIDKEAKGWTATIIFILIAAMILLLLIMALLVRGINRSLNAEIPDDSHPTFDDDDDDDK